MVGECCDNLPDAAALTAAGRSAGELTRLSRARLQWQLGDWEALASVSPETFAQHPVRAELALLAAAAGLRRGVPEQESRLVAQALHWDGDGEQAARLLISGVHNSLARQRRRAIPRARTAAPH